MLFYIFNLYPMENIKIFDNFMTFTEIQYIVDFIDCSKWNYGHTSGYRETITTPFFARLEMDQYFNDFLFEKIKKQVNKNLILNRCYTHIQNYGQNGGYHLDDSDIDAYTFCIWIPSLTEEELERAHGEFFIKPPCEKFVACIDILLNRGVFFPSHYLHKGMAYNQLFHQKRCCVTWKMKEIIPIE